MATETQNVASSSALEAEAFKKLYPEKFLERFLSDGIRPDGRPLGLSRPPTIAEGAVPSTADASALVKFGNSTALAGIKVELMGTEAETPDQGRLSVTVEYAPLCSPSVRPGRPPRAALSAQEHVSRSLLKSGAVDLRQLCIHKGVSAWAVYLDIYVLDADGSVADVALAAAVAALRSLTLPSVRVNPDGFVLPLPSSTGGPPPKDPPGTKELPARRLQLAKTPLSVTVGFYKSSLLVDLTGFEEGLVESCVTCTVDEQGRLLGFYKPGGLDLGQLSITSCIEAAKMRHKEIAAALPPL